MEDDVTMPNVIFLLDSAPRTWGTREEFHFRISQALTRQGGRSVLTYAQALPDAVASRLRESGATVETLTYNLGHHQYFQKLGALIRRHSIDLAHIRFFDYFSAIPWMARLHGVKRIVFTESNGGESRSTGWKQAAIRARTAVACGPIMRCIAISDFIRQRLIRVGIPGENVEVIYNGVDTAHFVPNDGARREVRRELALGDDEVVISTASALLPIKHVEVIVEACARLAADRLPFRLLVAGDGPLKPALQQQGDRLGVSQRICWLGHRADVDRLLQASDIFVLATTGEAFGNVLAEAMCCEVPVVGTESGGIPEVVAHGRTGLLARPEDPASLAEALGTLCRNPAVRRQYGHDGRRRAIEHFNIDQTVEKTLRLYGK